MPSVGWSGVEHATTGLWSEVTNHVSMLASLGLVDARRMLPDCIVPNVKIGG